MLIPQGVFIDPTTGALSHETGRYTKRASAFDGIFQDSAALARLVARNDDPTIYEVIEYRPEGSDLCFGTTSIAPGKVGDEFYMTRGHFHQRRDMAEVYYTQHGTGLLLQESRAGETSVVDMRPGVCAFIPPDWAHRSINIGADKLIFVWMCHVDAGHDYSILKTGMRKRVVERHGKAVVIDQPAGA